MTKRTKPLFNARTAALNENNRGIWYLLPRDGTSEQRDEARECVLGLIDAYGDVIHSYPLWHPLIRGRSIYSIPPYNLPCYQTGYAGLDNTICFRNAFVSCPYRDTRGADKIIQSVENFPKIDGATITAERLHAPLYSIVGGDTENYSSRGVEPVLVVCKWDDRCYEDASKMIHKRTALGLMVAHAVKYWDNKNSVIDDWEDMQEHMLGSPHGEVSSLFVDLETGRAIKKVFNTMKGVGLLGESRY